MSLRTKVLNICISNFFFHPCARYCGQCFGALDSGNNQDAGVSPGDLAHHRLPPEQASHHHRPHQACQRGGQVRHMLGHRHSEGVRQGEATQSSVWPDQPPSSPSTWPGVEHCMLETTSCPLTAPARNTARCLRPPSSWPMCQRKCNWRSCLHPKIGDP